MDINLPDNLNAILPEKAAAAGFGDDINSYVAHLIVSDNPAALTEAQLQQSLAMIEQGEADIEAGRFTDMRQTLLDIGSRRGYTFDE